MAFQTGRTTHPWWSIVGPCGNRVESLQSFVEPCETSGPTALAESCGTLKPSYNLASNHPDHRSPRRTSCDPARTVLEWNLTLVEFWWNSHGILPQTSPDRWWNPGETLVEPSWNLPRTTPHPRRNWWNPGGTLVRSTTGWWNPGGNLVERSWNLTPNHPGRSPRRTWRNPGRILVEIWWNPRGTFLKPDHPSPRRNCWNPGGTLVEPYLKPPRTTLQPWWNPRGTLPQTTQTTPPLQNLVEPWWNPGGTLVENPGGEPWWRTLVENPGGEPWWNLGGTPGGTLVEP